jgi:hypothetical protein
MMVVERRLSGFGVAQGAHRSAHSGSAYANR